MPQVPHDYHRERTVLYAKLTLTVLLTWLVPAAQAVPGTSIQWRDRSIALQWNLAFTTLMRVSSWHGCDAQGLTVNDRLLESIHSTLVEEEARGRVGERSDCQIRQPGTNHDALTLESARVKEKSQNSRKPASPRGSGFETMRCGCACVTDRFEVGCHTYSIGVVMLPRSAAVTASIVRRKSRKWWLFPTRM